MADAKEKTEWQGLQPDLYNIPQGFDKAAAISAACSVFAGQAESDVAQAELDADVAKQNGAKGCRSENAGKTGCSAGRIQITNETAGENSRLFIF